MVLAISHLPGASPAPPKGLRRARILLFGGSYCKSVGSKPKEALVIRLYQLYASYSF